jgi:hypothetical protein
MIIEHNAELYRVKFEHDDATHSHKVSGERRGRWFRDQYVIEYTPTTNCVLEQRVANEWTQLTRKQAVCNYSDLSVFSKEEGRKKSLEKVLNDTFLYRDTRAKFWEEYGKQTNKSWSTSL